MTFAPVRLLMQERDRWFYGLPVAIIVGIVAYFRLSSEPSSIAYLASPLCLLALLASWRLPLWRWVLAVPLCVALGFNASMLQTQLVAAPMLDMATRGGKIGAVLMKAEALPDGTRLLLKYPVIQGLSPEKTPLYLRLKTPEKLEQIAPPGSFLSFWGEALPFQEPVAPDAYDFRRHFYFSGIGASATAYDDPKIENERLPPLTFLDRFSLAFEWMRRTLMLRTRDLDQTPSGAMTAALLSGQQSGIDQEVMQAMRVSGLSHLLSISGVHVAMMGLLVYVPLRAFLALFPFLALRCPIKKWAAAGAIVAAFLYTYLVGPETPTLRSAMMTSIVLLAVIVDRRSLSLRLVVLSAALLMLLFPSDLVGPSFEMSFAAVIGMVVAFEKRLDAPEEEKLFKDGFFTKGFHALRDIVLTSLVATAATAPFTLYHFGNFSFYGILANMIAIPLTSFWVMPCILLTYLTMPLGLDWLFLQGTIWGNAALIFIAREVSSWPYSIFYFPKMPDFALALLVAGGFWLCIWRRSWRYFGLLPILIGLLYPLYAKTPQLFVAEGGGSWGVALDDGRLATSSNPEKFLAQSWAQILGHVETVGLGSFYVEDKETPLFSQTPSSNLLCGKDGCLYLKQGYKIALVRHKNALPEACSAAAIVVAPFDLSSCTARLSLGIETFEKLGALEIRLTPEGPVVQGTRSAPGLRPWSQGWPESGS